MNEKRYVITGGPCAGKSSVIEELKKRGYLVVKETAREVLEGRVFDKNNKNDRLELHRDIAKLQTKREENLGDKVYFMDRSLIDVFAYSDLAGVDVPKEVFPNLLNRRYAEVFLLDLLPFKKDDIRVEENEDEAVRAHNKIAEYYRLFSYPIICIPVGSVEMRVDLILGHIRGGKRDGMH